MRALNIACLTLVLSACGFHLRDSANLPFKSLYINLPPTSELRATIARNIAASSDTRIVESKEGSDAVLSVLGDTQVKTILSINSAGRVREYQLVRTFSYRVHDKAGNDLQPPAQIVLRRDVSYNDDQVLSKEAEEVLLRRDMQNDLVQQLLRRLAAAKTVAAPAPASN